MSRGSVRTHYFNYSVLLANGDVEVEDLTLSLVVSDGDVRVNGGVRSSVVIARGNVYVFGYTRSAICAGGRLISIHPRGPRPITPTMTVQEFEPNPLGVVRFTAPGDLGVDAVADFDGPLRVAASFPGGLIPPGTLHAGDTITHAGPEPVRDAVEFRRRVRDAGATNRPIDIAGLRAGRPFVARVAPR